MTGRVTILMHIYVKQGRTILSVNSKRTNIILDASVVLNYFKRKRSH